MSTVEHPLLQLHIKMLDELRAACAYVPGIVPMLKSRLLALLLVASAGAMVGSSLLFPMMSMIDGEDRKYSNMLLDVFVLSAAVFHLIHHEVIGRYGLPMAALAYLTLFVWVLLSPSPKADIAPYIPLFVVTLGLNIVAMPHYLACFQRTPPRLDRVVSRRQTMDIQGNTFLFAGTDGPPVERPAAQSTSGSEISISLSGIIPHPRATWDPLTRMAVLRSSSSLGYHSAQDDDDATLAGDDASLEESDQPAGHPEPMNGTAL